MRVNVQLIDAETGNHLWAERFDKPLADLFDMQDEIVARLAGALNTQLVSAEARRAEQAPNPDSMDLYFQGLAWFNKGSTPDNVAQARSFFDPRFPPIPTMSTRSLDRRARTKSHRDAGDERSTALDRERAAAWRTVYRKVRGGRPAASACSPARRGPALVRPQAVLGRPAHLATATHLGAKCSAHAFPVFSPLVGLTLPPAPSAPPLPRTSRRSR